MLPKVTIELMKKLMQNETSRRESRRDLVSRLLQARQPDRRPKSVAPRRRRTIRTWMSASRTTVRPTPRTPLIILHMLTVVNIAVRFEPVSKEPSVRERLR